MTILLSFHADLLGINNMFCFFALQDNGNEEFFDNLAVLELIQTIRSDHSLFPKYQHSSKLVKVINSFALTDCELPSGWEKKVEPSTKRVHCIYCTQ